MSAADRAISAASSGSGRPLSLRLRLCSLSGSLLLVVGYSPRCCGDVVSHGRLERPDVDQFGVEVSVEGVRRYV